MFCECLNYLKQKQNTEFNLKSINCQMLDTKQNTIYFTPSRILHNKHQEPPPNKIKFN